MTSAGSPEQPPAPREAAEATSEAALEAVGLGKRFGRTWALREVTFSLPAGEALLVLGPNGAGKSTLVGVLSTLLRPSAGEARIFGRSAAGEPEAVRPLVGVLAHQPMLYPHLTVAENLRLFARLFALEDPKGRASAALETFRLAREARVPVAALSHGTRRRVALARAWLHRPRLLLLDEPFAGLDEAARRLLRDLLRRLRVEGVTLLVTAHQLEPVADLVTTAAVLVGGRLRGWDRRKRWEEADLRDFYHRSLQEAEAGVTAR